MKIYVNYSESRHGGEVCAGQEEDRWPNYKPVMVDFRVGVCTQEATGCYYDTVETDFEPTHGETLFVVVVRYSDGNTFGQVNGLGSIQGVFRTAEEAHKLAEQFPERQGIQGYKLWEGYFSAFESADVVTSVFSRGAP